MRKKLLQFAAILLCAALCVPGAFAVGTVGEYVQIGLAYGSGALTAANLINNSGYGSGYRFGYFDGELEFEEVARTDEGTDAITMLRASEVYLSGSTYSTTKPSGSYQTIGCYHVVLDLFDSFEDAWDEAQRYDGGFVAWINGEYQVRQGAYSTQAEAERAMDQLGGLDVKGTSAYAVNVVKTGSTRILFQFDGGSGRCLGVMPDVTGADNVRTWFKGYRYQGGFRYERIGGGDLTVVNIVDMETYIKGVIPYEMSNDWPLEALKAQAVCARSYAYNNIQNQKHSAYHFDVCATTDCQVYHGVGSGVSNYQANELTDRAVEETAGEYALYNGVPIEAFYSSSHGGASESVSNVWGSSLSQYPYLCGVEDPYEQLVSSINSYSSWSVSYTRAELTQRLQARGFAAGTSVSSLELTYSDLGNVIQVKVYYANGKSNTFTPRMEWGIRSLFGVSSIRFTINGQSASEGTALPPSGSQGIAVNGSGTLDTTGKLYAISAGGITAKVDSEELYVITGGGSVDELDTSGSTAASGSPVTPTGTVVTITGSTYRIEGAGNGHQIGMSQYGAYAMAQKNFSYDEIVEFYYPGVKVSEY